MPPYLTSYSVAEEVEDAIDAQLFRIFAAASQDSAIGRMLASALRPETQVRSVASLKHVVRQTVYLETVVDVAKFLGFMVRSDIPTFLKVSTVQIRERGKTQIVLSIMPGTLGLPDPRYYNLDEQALRVRRVVRLYRDFLGRIAKRLDMERPLIEGIRLEGRLAESLYRSSLEQGTTTRLLTVRELKREVAPAIPWDALFHAADPANVAGLTETSLVEVYSPAWLHTVNTLFRSREQLAALEDMLAIHCIVHAAPFLPPPFDTEHFQLFQRELRGATEKMPQHVLAAEVIKRDAAPLLSDLYRERFCTEEEKRRAVAIVEEIQRAAVARIRGNSWLSLAARNACARKLEAIDLCVYYGTRATGHLYRIPEFDGTNLLENIYAASAAGTDMVLREVAAGGRHSPPCVEPSFAVNPYYYTDRNQMVVPAGAFMAPFWYPKRVGWNYGGIGAIVGHEISHAFDEEGRLQNELGEDKNLWSAADERAYSRKLKELVFLFSRAKVGDRVHVDGKRTASENLADLCGLGIALDACKARLTKEGIVGAERLRELREFFWSYATSWRTKDRPQRNIQDVFTDTHAPPRYRVNLIVPHFEEWYEAFGVGPDHQLYLKPEERIFIF